MGWFDHVTEVATGLLGGGGEGESSRAHHPPAHHAESAHPPNDPTLHPTASSTADVHRGMYDHGHEAEREDTGGLLGMLGSVTHRVAAVARTAAHAVAHPVDTAAAIVHQTTEAVAQARETAEEAVAGAERAVTREATEAVSSATTAIEHTLDRVDQAYQRAGVYQASESVMHDVQVMAGDIAEEAQDMGEGVVDFANEDLGLGDRPDVTVRPPEPPGDVSEEIRHDARERAEQVFAATDGLGTDPARLRTALVGASPQEMAVIRDEYWQLCHQNLDAVLDLETSGSTEREIQGLLDAENPADQAVAVIRGATTGLDTEPEAIRQVLRGLTPAERDDVIEQLGGPERAQQFLGDQLPEGAAEASVARLEGDEARAQAVEVTEAANGGLLGAYGRLAGVDGLGADTAQLNQVLGEIDGDPDARQALETAVAERTRTDGMGEPNQAESLNTLIDRATDEGPERNLSRATLDGDDVAIDAAHIAMATEDHWYENPVVIGTALTVVCPVAGLAYLAYHTADTMQSGRDWTDSADTEDLMHTMSRRPHETDADYQHRREAIRTVYNTQYGAGRETHDGHDAFDTMLADELTEGSADHRVMTDIVHNGDIHPDELARYAIAGHLGTNTELLRQAFHDPHTGRPLTATQVQHMRDEYARDGGDLIEDLGVGDPSSQGYDGPERHLTSEVSGQEAFEISELLRGRPETPEAQIEAALRRDHFTRTSAWEMPALPIPGLPQLPELHQNQQTQRAFVDLTSESGHAMDLQRDRLLELQERIHRGETVPPEELEAVVGRSEFTTDQYNERVDEATEGVAAAAGTAAAVAGAVVVDICTVGGATPFLIAGAAGAAGGLTELGVNAAMRGDRMSNEEIGTRVAQTGIAALTPGLGITGVPGALINTGLNEALMIGTGQEEMNDLGDVGGVGLRMAGSAAGEYAGGRIVEDMPTGTVPQRIIRGMTSGTARGLITPAVDPRTYEHGVEGALRTFGTSVAENAGASALDEVIVHGAHERHERAEAAEQLRETHQMLDEAEARSRPVAGPSSEETLRHLDQAAQVRDMAEAAQRSGAAVETDPEPEPEPDFSRLPPRTGDRFEIGEDGMPRPARPEPPAPRTRDQILADLDQAAHTNDVVDAALQSGAAVRTDPEADPSRLTPHTDDRFELDSFGQPSADREAIVPEPPAEQVHHVDLSDLDEAPPPPAGHDADTDAEDPGRYPLLPRRPEVDTSQMSPADQVRAEMFDARDPHRPPRTRAEATSVRQHTGGLSNDEARQVYQDRVVEIPGEAQEVANAGGSSEDQARRAFEIRHGARHTTRDLMEDQVVASALPIRDIEVHGNADGPSFESTVARQRARLEREAVAAGRPAGSVSDQEVHNAVIDSAMRTNSEVNEETGVEPHRWNGPERPPRGTETDALLADIQRGDVVPRARRPAPAAEAPPTAVIDGEPVPLTAEGQELVSEGARRRREERDEDLRRTQQSALERIDSAVGHYAE